MTKSRLTIGSTPWGESCAQVGHPESGYEERAKQECRAFVRQLRRHYETAKGDLLPDSLKLAITANPHDFGTYYDVQAVFEDEDQAAVEAAYWLEAHTPEHWDQEALLKDLGVPPWPFQEVTPS